MRDVWSAVDLNVRARRVTDHRGFGPGLPVSSCFISLMQCEGVGRGGGEVEHWQRQILERRRRDAYHE